MVVGKQAHHLFRVEQPAPLEQLAAQLLVCRNNVARRSVSPSARCGNDHAASHKK